MKIDEIRLKENSTERSTTYYNVASTYDALDEYHKAIEYYEKALAIDEVLLGTEHKDVLAEYEKLAIAYKHILKPNLSLKYWKKSLDYKEQAYGEYDLDTNETREKVEALEEQLKKKTL